MRVSSFVSLIKSMIFNKYSVLNTLVCSWLVVSFAMVYLIDVLSCMDISSLSFLLGSRYQLSASLTILTRLYFKLFIQFNIVFISAITSRSEERRVAK